MLPHEVSGVQKSEPLPDGIQQFMLFWIVAVAGTKLKVKILDQMWDCTVVEDSPYDPKNETIRLDG